MSVSIRMIVVIKRHDKQFVLCHRGYNHDNNPISSTERYWRNQGKHWIDEIDNATGYASRYSASKAEKLARKYL